MAPGNHLGPHDPLGFKKVRYQIIKATGVPSTPMEKQMPFPSFNATFLIPSKGKGIISLLSTFLVTTFSQSIGFVLLVTTTVGVIYVI